MASVKISNITSVWTSSATEFNAFKLNAEDSGSSGSSNLILVQKDDQSKFSVRKDGLVSAAMGFLGSFTGSVSGSASYSTLSNQSLSASVSTTASFAVSTSYASTANIATTATTNATLNTREDQ